MVPGIILTTLQKPRKKNMITLENKSSKSLKISNRLLLSLLASFITSFLLGIKSSVFIREVVFTDDVLKPSVFENEVHLKNELTPDDEDSDDEDSNDDEEVSLSKFIIIIHYVVF